MKMDVHPLPQFYHDPYHQFNNFRREPLHDVSDQGRIIPIRIESRFSPPALDSPDLLIEQNENNNGHSRKTNRGSKPTVKRRDSKSKRNKPPEEVLSDDIIDLCVYEDSICSGTNPARSRSDLSCDSDIEVLKRPRSKRHCSSAEITPTPNYPVYKYLKRRLCENGRQIDYIRGDGNCFFRALSKEVFGSESFHDDVRQAVVDLIEKYPKEFQKFMDSGVAVSDHVKDMRKTSTWASSAEIYAAATLLQRDIYVLTPDHSGNHYNWMLFKVCCTYASSMTYHPCFITLCHTHGNHYDRITPIAGKCNCDFEPPSLSGIKAYIDLSDDD